MWAPHHVPCIGFAWAGFWLHWWPPPQTHTSHLLPASCCCLLNGGEGRQPRGQFIFAENFLSPLRSLVPAENSSRFQSGFLSAGTVLSLPQCIMFNPQFCCSEQFLPSCLARTPGLLATTDTNTLQIIRFFVKYKTVDIRAVINCAVPQLGMPVRAKIISRRLSTAR